MDRLPLDRGCRISLKELRLRQDESAVFLLDFAPIFSRESKESGCAETELIMAALKAEATGLPVDRGDALSSREEAELMRSQVDTWLEHGVVVKISGSLTDPTCRLRTGVRRYRRAKALRSQNRARCSC